MRVLQCMLWHCLLPTAAPARGPNLVEGGFPQPVLPQQQRPATGRCQQWGLLAGLRLIGMGIVGGQLAALTGAQVEEQREDSAHAHHQQGQVLGSRDRLGGRDRFWGIGTG